MLRRYARQIIVIMTLVTVMMIVIFLVAQTSLNAYTDHTNRAVLANGASLIDSKIEETLNMTYQMMNTLLLTPLRQADNIFSSTMMEYTLRLHKSLNNYSLINNSIALNFILFTKSQYVVMHQMGQDLTSFSRNFSDSAHLQGYDMKSWLYELRSVDKQFLPRMTYIMGENLKQDVLPYIIWVGENRQEKIVAAVTLLNASKLDQLLSQTLSQDTTVFIVLDDMNRIVTSSRQLAEAEKALITSSNGSFEKAGQWSLYSASSRISQWRYVLLSDGQEAQSALAPFFELATLIIVACLVMIVCVTVLMIVKNRTMLRSIFNMLDAGESTHRDVYASINYSIGRMVNDKALMDQRLHEQNLALKEVYINNILIGNQVQGEEYLRSLGLGSEGEYYCCAILRLNAINESNTEVQRVKNIVLETLRLYSRNLVTCALSRHSVGIIFATKYEQGDSRFTDFIHRMYSMLTQIVAKNSSMAITLTVGDTHAGNGSVALSFSQARMMLLDWNAGHSEPGLKMYEHHMETSRCYSFTPEAELQIVTAIRTGNRPLVEKQLSELFKRNVMAGSIEYPMTVLFLYDFFGSILKIQPSSEESSIVWQKLYDYCRQHAQDLVSLEVQQCLIAYVYELTDSFAHTKKSHNQDLIDRIVAYVRSHYNDYDLTMYLVADEFNISSGYLSTFFKEQTGSTFSDYLTQIRMEEARRLLTNTHQAISEIATNIGYASATTFCRAFRKHYGVNPMQVRGDNKS